MFAVKAYKINSKGETFSIVKAVQVGAVFLL